MVLDPVHLFGKSVSSLISIISHYEYYEWSGKYKMIILEPGELVQWGRALAALGDDLGSVLIMAHVLP